MIRLSEPERQRRRHRWRSGSDASTPRSRGEDPNAGILFRQRSAGVGASAPVIRSGHFEHCNCLPAARPSGARTSVSHSGQASKTATGDLSSELETRRTPTCDDQDVFCLPRMHQRCLYVRMNSSPSLTTIDARVISLSLFVASTFGLSPSSMTSVSPSCVSR